MAKRRADHEGRAQQYRELYDQGLTCTDIAKRVRVSTSAVALWCRNNGLAPHGQGNTPVDAKPVKPTDIEARPVPSIPGFTVSRDGRLFDERRSPAREMVPRPHHESGPYRIVLTVGGRLRNFYLASLVLEAWVGARPEGWLVGYRDADPTHCHLDNLEWRPGLAKLDPQEFVRIWQDSYSRAEVAERLGTTYAMIALWEGKLRKAGLRLKKMFSGTMALTEAEIAQLNEIIASE